MNETGGEDDLLFRSLQEQGHNSAGASRLVHLNMFRHRAHGSVHTEARFCLWAGTYHPRANCVSTPNGKIFLWMLIGAGKAVLNSAIYAMSWLTRSPSRATYLDRAIRGAGKVFWWVDLRFYGASALKKPAVK